MTRTKLLALARAIPGILLVGCATTQTAWKSAVQRNTLAGYEEFLTRHENGVFADSAKLAIEQLDFRVAEKENSIAGYEAFLGFRGHST